jgi:hypothetical protein
MPALLVSTAYSDRRNALFTSPEYAASTKAVKVHTLLDLHGNIPTFISITEGKIHDVNILDEILPEAGVFYIMDRGYRDFERLFGFTACGTFFIVRTKSNVILQRRYSRVVDKSTGVRSDHTVILTAVSSAMGLPDALRRISYLDAETGHRFKFLINNFLQSFGTAARNSEASKSGITNRKRLFDPSGRVTIQVCSISLTARPTVERNSPNCNGFSMYRTTPIRLVRCLSLLACDDVITAMGTPERYGFCISLPST